MYRLNSDNLDREYLLYITNELYRLTLLFPKKEPLRYKMREISDEVLANFVSLPQSEFNPNKLQILKDSKKLIEVLDTFFEIVKRQGWVKASDVLNLQEEYSKINESLIKIKTEKKPDLSIAVRDNYIEKPKIEKKKALAPEKEKEEISERQQKILEILKIRGRAQVGDMKDDFSNVSKRTLRRDFRKLLKMGLVERIGEKNDTFYRVIGRTE